MKIAIVESRGLRPDELSEKSMPSEAAEIVKSRKMDTDFYSYRTA